MSKLYLNRRAQREKVVQTLFQLSLNGDLTVEEAIENAINMNPEGEVDHDWSVADAPYLQELIAGINAHKIDLDHRIQEQLENWSFTRITKVDLAILRLATYEMFYVSDDQVPKNVAINEAIEIAKAYSDDKSPAFINGVLSNMLKSE